MEDLSDGEDYEPPKPIIMRVDRPYVVGIIDQETNTILFKGYINNPNQ